MRVSDVPIFSSIDNEVPHGIRLSYGCQPAACQGIALRDLAAAFGGSEEVEKRGVPRFLPEAAFRPSDSAIAKSFPFSSFVPTLGPHLPLHRTNAVFLLSRPSWPGNPHPACHSAECASWSILNRRVDYLAIAKCRTLQHLPRCCPRPPITVLAALIKNRARGSTPPVLTRIASSLVPMAREL